MGFLKVDKIHKTYEGAPLLEGVSLDVAAGEIACLLGASGSGKTTLLRIIAGLEAPERGRVWLQGEDITSVPTHQRGIVLMFQNYALFPHKTVAQNVAFGLNMGQWGLAKDEGQKRGVFQGWKKGLDSESATRVKAMLTLVGLEGFAHRDVNELSGGEQQRVALARSLAPQPKVLLLDEPLGALDRNLRERLLEELPAILRRVGVTTITVTHDQEEAFALADRVILLNAGRVVQSGPPEAVYGTPKNLWVARFLGQTNLFPAKVMDAQHVKVSFGTLTFGEAPHLPKAGVQGTVLVHSWGIHLEEPPHFANPFTAKVTRRTFHGPVYQLALRVSGGVLHMSLPLSATVPNVDETVKGWIDPAALRWLG